MKSNNRPRKLIFCSPSIWRKIVLFKQTSLFKTADKFIYSRASAIPEALSDLSIFIYTGNKWHTRTLSYWARGFKFGELTWNRRLALYKAKQMRKKKKKF